MKYSTLKACLDTAKRWSQESKAQRLKVGSVIVRDGRVIVTGYNGCVAGGSNICEEEVNGELVTKQEVIHAEANAILFAARDGISTENCIIVSTHSPCFECSKMIKQCGIIEVYYENEYRDQSGPEFLRENNLIVKRIKE